MLLLDYWLSDGGLIFGNARSKNARLEFQQSLAHVSYILFVFNILSHYCSSSPSLKSGIRAGNRFYGLRFFTRSMPCLTELHSIFYPNGIKVIPQNIYNMLTPVALAHLIMGDGSVQRSGLTICTNSYAVQDIVRLMNVLVIRYRLECKIREVRSNRKLDYTIYIRQDSMPLLRTIVKPYLHPSMLYKLNVV